MLLAGRQEGHSARKKLSGGVVICLERGADLQMAQLMQLPLTISCFRWDFCYRFAEEAWTKGN